MKKTSNTIGRLCHLAAGLALGIATAGLAVADDTEVLVGNQLDPGDPNIVFIIDTSGSMDSDVVIGEDYDPEVTYAGVCDINRYYWTLEGTGTIRLPDCAFNSYVNKTAYQCFSGQRTIAQSGQFRDRHAQWDVSLDPNSWGPVTRESGTTNAANRLTECAADAGLHGDMEGDYYPADGAAGPWTTDSSLGVDWDTTGDLYTFFDGNYLNWVELAGQDTNVSSRIKVVQGVVRDVLRTPLNDVNIALMRFSTNAQGGMVVHEMVPVAQGREDIIDAVNSMDPQGATPLAETLYEASQYYAGRDVDFGETSEGSGGTAQPSVAASQNASGNYISPIFRQCQRNYVVLLTDGLPTGDTDADMSIQGLDLFPGPCEGSCLDDLAQYLDTADLRQGDNFPGTQSVQTFTIGFHTDQSLLEDAATGRVIVRDADGEPLYVDDELVTRSGYFIADDRQELARAFEDIFASIQTDGETFTAPALSVDTQNRLTNRDDLYFAMFKPATRGQKHWDGNLKKYRIGRVAGSDELTILDSRRNPVADADGVIVADARSFWSENNDGSDVTSGGFAGTLTANRNIYSNVTGGDLAAATNAVHELNPALTAAMLGVDPTDRDSLLKWARGLNADDSVRQVIGDPLHSTPTLLAYSGDRYALFFGTNDGMLHAIDPESITAGVQDLEHFAFIPKELLPNLAALKTNAPQPQYNAPKAYGLDGPITLWINETVKNGVVEGTERAYLYVGMRRGGRNYYALDVTDVNNPQLIWSIIGGAGNFVELGQTWSAPTPARVNWGGVETQVLFFAGGNDTNQDARDRPTGADDEGRAIYMVNALTGARLWWASISGADLNLPGMTHSIPSDLRVFDVDQDGLDDRIYVGDTGGKIWRFDIDNNNGNNATLTGDVFANLGGTGESGNRRIYSAPSVTRIFSQDSATGAFLTVSVGTGHRAHPLERDVADGFFMIRDINVFGPRIVDGQIDYPAPIVPTDLLDVTTNVSPSAGSLGSGWFINFDSGGEKSLSAPATLLDRIFFTTYIPAPLALTCEPTAVTGSGRIYSVNILTGAPALQAETPVPSDRYTDLEATGIPPSPTLVFTPPTCEICDSDDPVSDITLLVGTQALPSGIINVPFKTYWVQEDIDR